MTDNHATIPRFALFGEDSRKSSEELVHCETIEVRSRRYDWEIAPHRHPALCQILLVCSGSVEIFVRGSRSKSPVPLIFVAPPGSVHGFVFSPDVDGYVLTLSSRFLQDFAGASPAGQFLSGEEVHGLDAQTAARLAALASQMVDASGTGDEADLLRRALAEAFVRTASHSLREHEAEPGDSMVRQFQALVAAHAREEKKLAFYAGRLGCTERTLHRRVSDVLGLSPAQYLHERLAAEATRLLRFTNASCTDVAEELGFADPSYFSRFFARITGERPSAIRGSTARAD